MNHLKARQIETTEKWHYTLKSKRLGVIPVGRCADHDGHDTAEEAEECYKNYLLDERLRLDDKVSGALYRCRVCRQFTDGLASINGMWLVNLCDDHRTREEVEKIFHVGESWES